MSEHLRKGEHCTCTDEGRTCCECGFTPEKLPSVEAIAAWNDRRAEPVKQELADALRKLVAGITSCHYCGADLIPERGAAHCEDCPSGCESHDSPDCVQLSELIEAAKASLSAFEKERAQ